jgi:hypothetical protein
MEISVEELGQEQEQEQQTNECLVCLQPCEELSVDLFLYTCSCVYPVHDTCFKQWRSTTKNDRVCIICREELDYNTDEEGVENTLRRRRVPDDYARNIEENIDIQTNNCITIFCHFMNKIIYIFLLSIFIIVLFELISQRQKPTSRP